MKRAVVLWAVLLMLSLGASSSFAQGFAADPTPTPVPAPDSDSDGLPDSDDQCPAAPGPRENRGCPVENPPSPGEVPPAQPDPNIPPPQGEIPPAQPDPNTPPGREQVPPFVPPALSQDECLVTPAENNTVNVRQEPSVGSVIVGSLFAGQIYEALGYVQTDSGTWYVLASYEGSTGTIGYSAGFVLRASRACPQLLPPAEQPTPVVGNFSLPLGTPQPTLCHVSVGYDSTIWSSDPTIAQMTWASLWFAALPGTPIAAGTQALDVIFQVEWVPAFVPGNTFAVAPDLALFEQALQGGTTDGYVTPEGGISFNGQVFYRLTGDVAKVGACGPIVGLDNLTSPVSDSGVVQSLECFTKPGTTIVESCWCETSDTACVDTLTSICYGAGSYLESGPDMTACWYGEDTAPTQRPYFDYVMQGMSNPCEDDLSVWWIDVPHSRTVPTGLQDFRPGSCAVAVDGIPTRAERGTTRLIVGRGSRTTDPTGVSDCDGNGVPDLFEVPTPDCALDFTIGDGTQATAEDPAWWAQVLNLTCGDSNWIIMTEINEEGNEVVTDAQCEDDL